MKPRLSVNIKGILRLQVGFNCLLSHKGIILLMIRVSSGCFWCTSTLYGLMHMLTVKPLRCINTLWLGWYVRYHPCDMLDIPQQNPLKYGFSGIEIHVYIHRIAGKFSGGKVWWIWRIVRDLPNYLSTYIDNLLADLWICQTFFCQMLKKSQFAKLSPHQTFLL